MDTKEIWEGWTPRDFIESLAPEIAMIMTGASWILPFKTAKEMTDYIKKNQPYYKKSIPEVNSYFIHLYGLEDTDHE